MGKTSLANTFAEFLKSPTERSKPVLTKGTDLEFTKVMQLYDGLSVNQKKEIKVQVEELPRNGSVKLVKLQMGQEEGKRDVTSSSPLASSAVTETSLSTNKEKMIQAEDIEGTRSSKPSVLTTEASPATEGMSKSSKPTFEGRSSPTVPQKAGKRERFKKIFTSLFTRANAETLLADEEDKEKEESEDDIERTNPNQETPAPGDASDDETSDNDSENETSHDETSDNESENGNKNDVQLKLVDMGGHSATVVLTAAFFFVSYVQL